MANRESGFTAPGDWFEILFNHSPDAIYVTDLDGAILMANRTACERMQRNKAELEQMRMAELHAPETRAKSAGLLETLASEGSVRAEVVHQAKDGTKIATEVNSTVFNAEGRRLVLAIARDISDRRRAEEKADVSEQRFRLLFESSGTSNALFDLDCRMVLCNLFCSQTIGQGPPGALIGKPLEQLFGPGRGGVFRERMLRVVATGRSETHESEFPFGPLKRWLQTSYNPLFGPDGRVSGVQLISHDITESHRSQERLLQTEKLQSIEILAEGLAHDFNNLLAGLSGNLELLDLDLRDGKTDDARGRLKVASQVFARAKALTKQLLTFSKGGEPVMGVHDLSPWLSSWAEFALSGSGLGLVVEVPTDLWFCRCDLDQIGQVVDNLVINARQACPGGGKILVQAENLFQDRPFVRIRVTDQGEGIPADHLKNVFDPFFTTKPNGSGLGLATCRSIVAKHGGWMEIESEVGRGTTVSVFLPAPEPRIAKTLPLIPAPRSFVPSGPTLDASGQALKAALVPRLGFVPAHHPEEAYELEFGPTGATLQALGPAGLANGRTTWAALQAAGPVPAGRIEDEPRFGWRGLMLDCSRHFYPVADIKAILDRLAALKLNRFHWHLVDDQGWRLEIPAYPKFTEVGAWRAQDDGRYGGFYTAADVGEVVAYAAARHIVVVPEIELPGHSLAALASYPELSCSGAPEKVETQWGIFDGIYCASSEVTAGILEAVLDEVCRLFPSPWIHIGGDEVVRTRWEACPRCQTKIKDEGLDGVAGLEAAFFRRFIAFLAARGKTAVGWNELAEHKIPRSVPVQWWHRPDLARQSLEAGNPLLVSDVEYCYFDYPYTESDPWYVKSFMKVTPVEKVYSNPVVPVGCGPWVGQIWGGEACLWTERVPPSEVDHRLRGRLEAFAEVYWTFDRRPGWASFEGRAGRLGLL